MKLSVRTSGCLRVIDIDADCLDASTHAKFKAAMKPLLAENTTIALNLRGINFIDSAGLGAMLTCARKLKSQGGELCVYGPSRQARMLFELVALHRVVTVLNNEDELLRYARQHG